MERADLIEVLTATGCAVRSGEAWFLINPRWTAAERAQAESVMRQPAKEPDSGWLGIPTGGSSGGVKFARHDEKTLGAAVAGFCRHFGLTQVNAIDVLPPFHVSGLMARLRSVVSGGQHRPWEWREIEQGGRPVRRGGDWVISLVPTQLERLLRSPETVRWLQEFRVVLVGGGPLWPDLLQNAAQARVPLAPSYGMTETAAMVSALRPDEFLAGARDSGRALPHVRLTLDPAGLIVVEGDSVCRGYWPTSSESRRWVTEDLGELSAAGHLRVLGRRDAVIITGGEKVQPAEVEAVLRSTGQFEDVAVIGVPDAEWGEAVVACHPPQAQPPDADAVRAALERLSAYKRPKRYVQVGPWPRTEQGKVNRAALRARAGAPGAQTA